ncbi:MAG: hypothetical protein JWO04_3260, partial [Gammaproteobacteria bacterium]|nr:hypothetical protein [Gammaproteobacteria bacterium]
EMNRPGVWILGDLEDDDRLGGMGIVVEYAGASGIPQWAKPRSKTWELKRSARICSKVDAQRPEVCSGSTAGLLSCTSPQ